MGGRVRTVGSSPRWPALDRRRTRGPRHARRASDRAGPERRGLSLHTPSVVGEDYSRPIKLFPVPRWRSTPAGWGFIRFRSVANAFPTFEMYSLPFLVSSTDSGRFS